MDCGTAPMAIPPDVAYAQSRYGHAAADIRRLVSRSDDFERLSDAEWRCSDRAELSNGHPWGCFGKDKSVLADFEDGHVGNDRVDARHARQWQCALFNDLWLTVPRHVLGHHDYTSDTVHEVHCPAHPFDHLARDHPVGKVAALADLHRAEDGRIHMAAADHAERLCRVEAASADHHGDEFLAGIDQFGVDLAFAGVRADTE